MKKKQYIVPRNEVVLLGPNVIMTAFGPASMPEEPSSAPKRKTEVF